MNEANVIYAITIAALPILLAVTLHEVAHGWVANKLGHTVTRIDPTSGKPVATIGIGNEPQRVAAGAGSVWVTVRAPETAAKP